VLLPESFPPGRHNREIAPSASFFNKALSQQVHAQYILSLTDEYSRYNRTVLDQQGWKTAVTRVAGLMFAQQFGKTVGRKGLGKIISLHQVTGAFL
jgi:hypothetical protein